MAFPTLIGHAALNPGTSNDGTMTVAPDSTIATGHWMIMVLTTLNSSTVTTAPTGWTILQDLTISGTLATAIYGKIRAAGETSYTVTISSNETTSSVLLFWGAGGDAVSNWIVGANKLRPSISPTTTYNNVAPSVTTAVANSLALIISTERTTATETDVSSVSGATEWYFSSQVGSSQLETTMVAYIQQAAAGPTGDVTVVYPNTQANNGMARQIIIPPIPAGPAFIFTTSTLTVSFDASASTASTGTITNYAWNYGDSSTGNGVTSSHTYSKPGSYTVTLTTTASDATTASVSHSVSALGLPVTIWNGTSEVAAGLTVYDGTNEFVPASMLPGASPVSFSQLTYPIRVAHRGGSANWPEESVRSYKESADVWGMQAIEISVQVSQDGTFWCSHDATTTRVTGQNYTISATTDAVLSTLTNLSSLSDNPSQPNEPMAKLSDVLALYAGKRVIFIEDKTYSHQAALLDIMDANGGPNYFVWKQAGTGTIYSQVNTRGYRSWGYFFDADMASNYTGKQAQWSYVGLDYNSSDATLTSAIATAGASRVIGHIIPNVTQYNRMLGFGMIGLMIANVRDCLPKILT